MMGYFMIADLPLKIPFSFESYPAHINADWRRILTFLAPT